MNNSDAEETEEEEDEEEDEEEEEDEDDSGGAGAVQRIPIGNLRKIVRKIRKSTKLRQKLKQLCDFYEMKPLVPIIDVSTRWNSTYKMLSRALHLRVPFGALCLKEKALIALRLDESDWETINTLEAFLKRFDRATQLISMERHPTISSYLPIQNWLTESLTSCMHDEHSFLASAAEVGLEKLMKYELNIRESKLPFIATILDPALKLNYYKEHNYSQTSINEIKKIVSDYFETNYEDTFVNEDDDEEMEDELFAHIYKRTKAKKVSTEFVRYINLPLTAAKIGDCLGYWKSQQSEFPCLSKMARDFLAIQATSVAVERDNSAGADLVTANRCALKANTIQATMCLKRWFKN